MSERLGGESGQALPLMVIMIVVLLGFVSIVVDVGRLHVAHEQLVAAVDAAALAAGNDLPKSENAYAAAIKYDGSPGAQNQLGDGITVNSTTVTFECNSTATADGVDCQDDQSTDATGNSYDCSPPGAQPASTTTCNAVKVTQTATVNLVIGGIFHKSWTISATALAAASGGYMKPINAYVILDNSGSMDLNSSQPVDGITPPTTAQGARVAGCDLYGSAYDVLTGDDGDSSACGLTQINVGDRDYTSGGNTSAPERIDEAKAGVQTLLQTLKPCNNTVSCGTATDNTGGELGANVASPDDRVGLLVFPAINATSSSTPSLTNVQKEETDCDPLHGPDGMSGSNPSMSPSTTDPPISVTYPTWSQYTYNPGDADGGIPTSDIAPGYEIVGLSSDYRASDSDTDTTLTPDSKLVDAVSWADCPSYTYDGTTQTYPGSGNPAGATCVSYQQSGTGQHGSSQTCGGTSDNGATAQADTECDTAGNYDGQTGKFTTAVYSYSSGGRSGGTSNYKATCQPYWTVSTTYDAGSWPGGGFYGLKVIGGAGSYLAGAITEAQYLLDQNAESGVENVIIVVSDGGMNDPTGYASWPNTTGDPCKDAIDAAQQATAAGTTVYAIGYGDTDISCGGNSGQWEMQSIASDPNKDYIEAGSDLKTAFQQAAEAFSTPRLLPTSDG